MELTETDIRMLELEFKKLIEVSNEELAEWLHIVYEEISIEEGWNTQESCKVPFNDLPPKNKAVMIKLADNIKKAWQ